MQAQKNLSPYFSLSLALFVPLMSCVAVPTGTELGAHGGFMSQGLHFVQQTDPQWGLEVGFDQRTSGWGEGRYRQIYGNTRYYLNHSFQLRGGLFYAYDIQEDADSYDSQTSTELHAQTAGLKAGLGNIWHYRNGMTFGVEYLSIHYPLALTRFDLEAQGGRLAPSVEKRTRERALEPVYGIVTLFLGFHI